jgi:hypothetical protein
MSKSFFQIMPITSSPREQFFNQPWDRFLAVARLFVRENLKKKYHEEFGQEADPTNKPLELVGQEE